MSWFEPAVSDTAASGLSASGLSASGPFGRDELPYGVYAPAGLPPRVGVAVGNRVIDLAAVWRVLGHDPAVFEQPSLNPFLAQGRQRWDATRRLLQSLLSEPTGRAVVEPHLSMIEDVELRLPIEVADYVDFYASADHAWNVGRIFRPDGDPLTPNWRHMPIGYHGRAGTVVVSGTEVIRPRGQRKPADALTPSFGPSRRLDIEAELGWVVGVGSSLGDPVTVEQFREHVFGVVILNDWSARDLQAWEYVPLGPFLGKSFATSISAWVLPIEALEDARIPLPDHRPALLPYLAAASSGYAIDVEVELNGHLVSTCPYAEMYYSPAQMLAHLTVNGARLRTGDLYGSGTISGPLRHQRGSLLELTWNGSEPLDLGEAGTRTFLEDGDEVVMRAVSRGHSAARLGEVRGTIVPGPT
ncbi:MAG TPA: fumarylacetoacetase [Propionibacteriaceae bacterium]|nr:fumarylacetoacetase [Propionibacteriaceae bacterium]